MKKHLALFMLLSFFSFAGMDWLTVKLDDSVSVQFPTQPEVKDLGGTPYWSNDTDGEGRCVAMITDYGKLGVDSIALIQSYSRVEALAELRNGLLRDFKNSKLINEKRIRLNDKIGFELYIDTGEKETGYYNRMYYKAIVFRDKLYSLYFYESDLKPNKERHQHFFDSLVFK